MRSCLIFMWQLILDGDVQSLAIQIAPASRPPMLGHIEKPETQRESFTTTVSTPMFQMPKERARFHRVFEGTSTIRKDYHQRCALPIRPSHPDRPPFPQRCEGEMQNPQSACPSVLAAEVPRKSRS